MILTYTTYVGLPKISLAIDWPTQMKITRTAPARKSSRDVTPSTFGSTFSPRETVEITGASVGSSTVVVSVRLLSWVEVVYKPLGCLVMVQQIHVYSGVWSLEGRCNCVL